MDDKKRALLEPLGLAWQSYIPPRPARGWFRFELPNPPRTMTRQQWRLAHRWLRECNRIVESEIARRSVTPSRHFVRADDLLGFRFIADTVDSST